MVSEMVHSMNKWRRFLTLSIPALKNLNTSLDLLFDIKYFLMDEISRHQEDSNSKINNLSVSIFLEIRCGMSLSFPTEGSKLIWLARYVQAFLLIRDVNFHRAAISFIVRLQRVSSGSSSVEEIETTVKSCATSWQKRKYAL